jgi:hypothetical protein
MVGKVTSASDQVHQSAVIAGENKQISQISSQTVQKANTAFDQKIQSQEPVSVESEREIMIEMLIKDHHMLPDVAAAYYDQMLC